MHTYDLPHNHGNIEWVLEQMPDVSVFNEATMIFQTLSDSSRLQILWLLCHHEECGINIASIVHISPAAVSHHIKALKLSGLITSRRDGKEVYYKLSTSKTAVLVHQMVDMLFQVTCPTKGID
jgi:DNA-binding transcriptional ArsR family regulator